ncbi:response regulator [Sulfitobacter aestuarii]|uniref:DNA-binding transcriptional regulator NtrC n=1 Tax=Sulfitobacter aestuarii TaxID=2161676 RepID=A0ABW5U0A3_9RHOB
MDGTVLVADDDRTIRTVLTQALTRAGCKVHATSSLTTLMRWVGEGMGDVVISDVAMPDGNGLEMLPKIAADRPELPVIVISAQNTIMTAIKASEAKAFDYLPKPFDLPDLMKRTARALEHRGAGSVVRVAPVDGADQDLPLLGRTPVMQRLYDLVARLVRSDLPVLIRGESGTGKTLIARLIHDFSDRRAAPFVTLSAGDLQEPGCGEPLLARARGGSLLIEEIGDIVPAAQAELLRMIDAPGEAPPRFLATSQADLAAALQEGRLRSDLFYRLSGATLDVPALRERVEDIPLLAAHFLQGNESNAPGPQRLSRAAEQVFARHPWPGNVRQLEHAIAQLALTSRDSEISAAEAEQVLGMQTAAAPRESGDEDDRLGASVARHLRRYFDLHGAELPPPGLYARILREVETPLIEIGLEKTFGNQAKCAELLGINRNTLRKKITELDIEVTRGRKMM